MQRRPTRTVVEPDEQSEVNQPGLEPCPRWSRVHACCRGPGSPGALSRPQSRRLRNAARTDTGTGRRGLSSDPLKHIGHVDDKPERGGVETVGSARRRVYLLTIPFANPSAAEFCP